VLNNILIFNIKVLIYNTFIINYCRVFIINDFKVFILLYLYKNNYNIVHFNNSFVKLKVINKIKLFIFLYYKLRLF
jgi:hypothetical protein